MELNDIKIFIEIYNNKSISKTAEKLNYSQSNISTRLMKLEKEFHTPFFIRSKNGLEILPSAERLFKYCLKIVNLTSNLYSEFNIENEQVNIASTQLLSRLYYPLLFKQNTIFQLHTAPAKKLKRDFENQIFDIIITHTQMTIGQDITEHQKFELLCWAQSELFTHNVVEQPSIIVSRDKSCPLRNASFQAITKYNLDMPIIEVDTLDLLFSLLHSTNSIALLPQKIIKDDTCLLEFSKFKAIPLNIFFYFHNKNHENLLEVLFL